MFFAHMMDKSWDFESSKPTPGAAHDIWGIPRQKDPQGLKQGLKRFKLKGKWLSPEVSKDELDALTCAIIVREDLVGNTIAIGDPDEG